MTLSICIFAHNEEKLLPDCIGALDRAANGHAYQAHILVNGCTDQTAIVANSLAAVDDRLNVHELPVADKANAWNDYVFRIARGASAHIFLDADIRPSENAFSALLETLQENPNAYAAAALPASGRSRRQWTTDIFLKRHLSGNLYALTEKAIQEFRNKSLQLPFGAKGEDGLIAYLLLTDFCCGRDDSHDDRIATSETATFEFDSLGLNISDLKTYHKRLIRYSERYFQKQILYRLLKNGSAQDMPANIYDIYLPSAISSMRPRIDPINFWYDFATLKRLRAANQ